MTPRRLDSTRDPYPPTAIKLITSALGEDEETASKIISAAILGRETDNSDSDIENWITNQLLPNTVLIDKAGYTEMCIDALKTTSTMVLSDFGSSKQRDFGQAWSDTIRGYLGEYAVVKFLKEKYGLDSKLAHQRGTPGTFYDSDISEVYVGGTWRKPSVNVGIKTAKYNGLWLDVPSSQFPKSNYHVQVKTGAGSTHLFSFFKDLSVFKDKILPAGISGNYLTQKEADEIWNDIPAFKPIPAYITGFAIRDINYLPLDYAGHKGRIHYKINEYRGLVPANYKAQIRSLEKLNVNAKVDFESIGDFSSNKFVFNTGSLKRTNEEWKDLVTII